MTTMKILSFESTQNNSYLFAERRECGYRPSLERKLHVPRGRPSIPQNGGSLCVRSAWLYWREVHVVSRKSKENTTSSPFRLLLQHVFLLHSSLPSLHFSSMMICLHSLREKYTVIIVLPCSQKDSLFSNKFFTNECRYNFFLRVLIRCKNCIKIIEQRCCTRHAEGTSFLLCISSYKNWLEVYADWLRIAEVDRFIFIANFFFILWILNNRNCFCHLEIKVTENLC